MEDLFEIRLEEIEFSSICKLFPKRKQDAHKGNFGRLLCITGSERMPGAACMASQAALRCGVGLMTTATAERNVSLLAAQCWESMYLPLHTDANGFITWHENKHILLDAAEKADAILIGCGLGVTEGTVQLVENILKNTNALMILDADGLNIVSRRIDIIQKRETPVILTPHPGEMARLLNRDTKHVQSHRKEALHQLCRQLPNAVVVLKGHHTLIGYREQYWINRTGNPGMSTGGSGDVLAGMIASFAAQGLTPADSAWAGVYLHGMAGDFAAQRMSEASMLPRDLIACIPEVFLKIEAQR